MPKILNFSAFGISTGVHAVLLSLLAFFQLTRQSDDQDLTLETVFVEDRLQEEFTQELQESTDAAVTLNPIAGGTVTNALGAASGPPAPSTNIETSESLKDPEIEVNVGDLEIPTDSTLTEDLGEGQITGETGAAVEGYGVALGRMAQELVRLMRTQRVHVVWLFDESESMKDDQEEIAKRFDKVYVELGLALEKDEKLRRGEEDILTSIWGYGETTHDLTKTPTKDLEKIRSAISSIAIDESGLENMCGAIQTVIGKYRLMSAKQKRKLVIVIVSDESGDDGLKVDDTIAIAAKTKTPVYVMGRESVFGYPYARQRWKDPKYGLYHWLRINRGPETAFPEALQWNGLHARWDAYNAGFGPYEMVRLARETNGIFFILPGEEEDLSGPGAHDRRKFAFLDMKEYQPLLLPRKVYLGEVNDSPFRKAIWETIVMFNPNENDLLPGHDPQLNIRRDHYSIEALQFREQARREVIKAARAMALLNQAIPIVEELEPLRAKEPSRRWRANYDLVHAQLLSYRVRLFQYLLAMDQHANTNPAPEKEQSNEWNVRHRRQTLKPDDAQFERIKEAFKIKMTKDEYLAMLAEQEKRSLELYDFVKREHPGTPWARRAQSDIDQGFGMYFVERFWNPNYSRVGIDIKLPNL